jgi:hypothetical protein
MLKENSQHKKACGIDCLSWTSVFAGTLVAIGLSFLFNLFGLAVGLSAYSTAPEGHTMLVAGGYLGMVASVMISMFIGGWVSGYLGKEQCSNKKFGILYGFITWCITLILSIFITAHVGQFITIQQSALAHNELMVKLSTNVSHSMSTSTKTENMSTLDMNNAHHMNALSKKETHAIGGSLLLTFLLFLAGAIMSAYGGYRGIRSKK